LRLGEEREQGSKSGEQSVGAEDFVFHGDISSWQSSVGGWQERKVGGLGSWQWSVGGDQIADGKWRMSEEKLSSLRAENCSGR
jgi:hypothetical protein